MTETPRRVVCNRAEWLTYETTLGSEGLRREGLGNKPRYCCIGVYLRALGMTDKQIGIAESPQLIRDPESIPAEARWLLDSGTFVHQRDSEDCRLLQRWNDRTGGFAHLTQDEAEKQISAIFAKHGVEFVFEGDLFPTQTSGPAK